MSWQHYSDDRDTLSYFIGNNIKAPTGYGPNKERCDRNRKTWECIRNLAIRLHRKGITRIPATEIVFEKLPKYCEKYGVRVETMEKLIVERDGYLVARWFDVAHNGEENS